MIVQYLSRIQKSYTFNISSKMYFSERFWCLFYLFFNAFHIIWADTEPQQDFTVIWNVPLETCSNRNIYVDLAKYNIVYNKNFTFKGGNMTIFYNFGKFPKITKSGEFIDGGIPQLGQFLDHEKYVTDNITAAIPNSEFNGYAVLDWETWRPTWATNWDSMNIYREESRKLVRKREPNLSNTEVDIKAINEFETAARFFMESAINIGQKLRPKGKWGYYGFPHCYNYGKLQKYCPENIQRDNDRLTWLYNASSVLYPTIYISKKNITDNSVYVYGTLQEAKRVGQGKLPIFPYAIVHYPGSSNFMSKEDLLITIGQTAGLGFPGVVLWGSSHSFLTQEKCEEFRHFVDTVLGPTLNQIRTVVKHNTKNTLHFPDSLNEELWAEKIMEYYK